MRAWLDSGLPEGEVTFLLGDAAGSTRLWETDPQVAARAVERMERTVARVIERRGGFLPRDQGEGDSFFAVFDDSADAAAAAIELQAALADPQMPIRMALHTGGAQLRDGNYFGVEVNRCARIRCLAGDSQVLISRAAYEAMGGRLPEGAQARSLGIQKLRDLSRPEEVFALTGAGADRLLS